MNIGSKFLRGPFNAATIESAFRQLVASVLGGWEIQHKSDGTHGDVTADSLVLGDDARVGGNLRVDGNLHVVGYTSTVTFGNDDDGSVPIDGLFHGPDTREDRSAWPSVDVTADVTTPLFAPASGLAPILDDAWDLGYLSNSTESLRFRSGYFGSYLEAPVVHGTTALYERERETPVGEWIAVAYSAGNFTASAGTWGVDSGDQVTYRYTLIGKTMTLAWTIKETDVSSAAQLRLAIPGSHTAAVFAVGVYRATNAGGSSAAAVCSVSVSGTYVTLSADMDGNDFSVTSGDNTWVQGSMTFEVS